MSTEAKIKSRIRLLRWSRSHSFWVQPCIAILVALPFGPLVRWIDRETHWRLLDFSPQGASLLLGSLGSAMLTFVVFVVSSLLVVVQLASAQLTPRIIALTFESIYIRRALALFAFSFAFTIGVGGRITDDVPQLATLLAIVFCLASLISFFYFANRLAIDLRPVSILTRVGHTGLKVIKSVYPSRLGPDEVEPDQPRPPLGPTARIITHSGVSGAVRAFDLRAVIRIATDSDVVIEMVPQVGDFVPSGGVLFRVSTGGRPVDDEALRRCVAIGPERTLEQDPRFAFRIVVDIANKALSPAINDPTTAVLAIDQIHQLLLAVGLRRLDEGDVRDAAGKYRLHYGTPDWDDYVCLGISEIRQFGATSLQVARRLFALLTNLIQLLPETRAASLRRELGILRRTIDRSFPEAEDRIRALVADAQGMGGSEPIGTPSSLEASTAGEVPEGT